MAAAGTKESPLEAFESPRLGGTRLVTIGSLATAVILRLLCYAPTTNCSAIGAAAAAGTKESSLEAIEIDLRVGAKHLVTLGGLASAGYMWSEAIEGPDGVVGLIQTPAEGPAPSSPPAGGPPPGTSSRDLIYRITALKPGRVRVRFALRRPWETGKAPLREVIIDITVSE